VSKNYNIIENNAISFATNKSIRFPRFQRKQTWDDNSNFKLCISIFKGYPIGVVIVNSQKGFDYLLDGRQRRNAIILMKDNPSAVYIWAKKFVGFKPTDTEDDVKDKFWKAMDVYLQKDASNENILNANEELEDSIDDEGADLEVKESYDFEKQYNSLKSLLELVLLSHPMKSGKTNLEKMYEFNECIDLADLEYVVPKDGKYVTSPVKLKKYIDSLIDDELTDVESFSNSIVRRYKLDDKRSAKLKDYVEKHWDFYNRSMNVISEINNVLNHATIGMIALTNASILDAQNIFSLVNASGTPLTAEELLSARPFWNFDLKNPSAELLEYKKDMYKFLNINIPENTCRWDLCSTFLKRIDKNALIFENNEKNSFQTSISLSYKIISALKIGGISKISVTSLENANVDWEVDIEKYIRDINFMISLIEDINFFKCLKAWNQSIMSLTSNTIAIEFCVVMYKLWEKLGKPTKCASVISEFNKKAIILCDRLFYEYCIRLWSGSSDSLIAAHLKESDDSRFVAITTKEWTDFINEIANGKYKGKNTTSKTLKPFIYYYYFLNNLIPTLKNNSTKYEIDHIVAQNLFDSHEENCYKDNFLNFSLLPKGENIEKNDKKLNEIKDDWLIEQIKKYSGLNKEEIEQLSDLTNLDILKKRKELYLEAYTEKRDSLFKNKQ